MELIILDDGSKDGTWARIGELERKTRESDTFRSSTATRVRGNKKVFLLLMFGLIVVTAEQIFSAAVLT